MKKLQDFVDFAKRLKGDEKGEAQLFCDRFFRAFGHGGILEAQGTLEARIKFADSGRTKFADCLWSPVGRDGVLIEMKRRTEKNLETHFPQVRDYWIEMNPEKIIGRGAQKPKYIILCNFERFIIYQHLSRVDEITLDEFVDRASAFNFMLPDHKEPDFRNNVEKISYAAAHKIGKIFKHLVYEKKENREASQRFLLQCVLALFSEDFGILPQYIFTELIRDCQKGQSTHDLFGSLFRQMASEKPAHGGRFKDVKYFNGGIFDVVEPLEFDNVSLSLLAEACEFNWKSVNPSIFGALFESTLTEGERHKFGAHYTSEADILKIVIPTITRPWRERLNRAEALQELTQFLDDLGKFRVLDPACGCGNFLYMAYLSLKDIEMQAIEKIAAKFTKRSVTALKFGFSRVSAMQFYGIDILPVAVEVAKVTMMLAKELAAAEWNKRITPFMSQLGLNFDEGLPLDRLDDCIKRDDALFCEWPEFDVIIGNPPYQSKNKMQLEMDRDYINRVRARYPEVPGRADYCVYWFRRAHDEMKEGQRAGLVGTNTIRQNYSREGGLDYIVNNGGTITDAISTQAWSGDAAVHVSIVNWMKGEQKGPKRLAFQRGDSQDSPFEYFELEKINSALSVAIDLTSAQSLTINVNSQACFQGQTHGHEGFLITIEQYTAFTNKKRIYPYLTGDELLSYAKGKAFRYIIDLNHIDDVFAAQREPELYAYLKASVYPSMKENAEKERSKSGKSTGPRQSHFKKWWKFWRPRDEMIMQINKHQRFIVCSRVTKRPIFEFISSKIHPNDALQIFPLPDDYSFGVLQSSIHWEWFTARCSTLTERFRYTSNSVFDSFPWPQKPTKPQVEAIAKAAVALRQMRRKVMAENNLSLRELYRTMEETPNNPVSEMHEKLDNAVRSAYGMKKNADVLAFLLDLNLKLAEKERNGETIIGPGLPPTIENPKKYVTEDCVRMR